MKCVRKLEENISFECLAKCWKKLSFTRSREEWPRNCVQMGLETILYEFDGYPVTSTMGIT